MSLVEATRHREADAGFSLIEVLVTLTILAGLMAVFTPLAGRMLSTWALDANRAGRADMMTAAIDRLRRDIAVALPVVDNGADPPVMRFRGTKSGFSFVAATGGAPELVTVSTSRGPGGTPSLLRSSERTGSADAPVSVKTRVALLDNPITASFAFRSRTGEDSPDWQDAAEMPQAVVVTFTRYNAVLLGGTVVLPVYATLPILCTAAGTPSGNICRDAADPPAGADGPADGQSSNEAAPSPPRRGS